MPTAQELFDKYMRFENSEIDHKTISMFGYYASEILEALEFWEKSKMHDTRQELVAKIIGTGVYNETEAKKLVKAIEALGLIKFKEDEKRIKVLLDHHNPKYGTISIQQWPEGLVIYVGGEIRYKSWE